MQKFSFFFILSLTVSQTTRAQTMSVSGSVKSEKGLSIPFAFVQDKKSNTAIYTDSLGAFSIQVNANAVLLISSKGYKDEEVKISDDKNLQIVLKTGGAEQANKAGGSNINNTLDDAMTGHTNFNPTYNTSNATQGGEAKFNGASFPIRREKEDTKGNRYLFNTWVKGSVTDSKNMEVNNPAYLFNYDKMGGGLLLTHDKRSAIEIDKEQIKSFTLYNQLNEPLVFEMVPAIDNVHYVQLLSGGSKYKIYKLTKTKFIKSDYATNGLVTTGNSYDEFVDENVYYAFNVQNNQARKFALKKKSIKEAFDGEPTKLNPFFDEHSGDQIDDHFLGRLGEALNK